MAIKRWWMLLVLVAVFGFSGMANATLTTIGQAHYGGQTYNMIWDNDSPFGSIVWLDYTRDAYDWADQVAWASGLNTPGTLTYTIDPLYNVTWTGDWRLPITVDGPYVWGYDGTTTAGYNITSSELGHLFYAGLGNKGYYATDGTNPQPAWGLTNAAPFTNLRDGYDTAYWSGTEYSLDPGIAWVFGFYYGDQVYYYKDASAAEGCPSCPYVAFALAVSPGDVSAVPEPSTMLLLGSGLIGLAGYGRRKFFNK